MGDDTTFLMHRLQSGAQVVGQPMGGVESAALGISIGAGARDENPAEFGVSHFVEQMLFRGTETLDARQLSDRFDSLGINYDSSSGIEMTMLTAIMLGDRAPAALELLGNVVRRAAFPADAVDNVRSLIQQERRQREDHAAHRVLEVVRQEFYRDTPLGHDMLGTPESVDSMSREDLVRYWSKYYTAPNLIFSIAGNFDWEALIGQLEDLTAAWPAGSGPAIFSSPAMHGGVTVLAKDIEQENIAMAFPGVAIGDPRYYAAALVAQALGGGMNSRLFQEVREKRGLAYGVQARLDGLSRSGLFRIYVGTAAERAHESIEVILEELGKLEAEGLHPEELELGKIRLKSSQVMRSESTSGRMMANLRSWWFEGRLKSPREVQRLIDQVSLDDVNALVRDLDIRQNLAIVALGPRSEDELFGGVFAGG
ncbi:MAG TPA: pitrilysin family protein [Chloroflexota bacterium]|nr:pitrilysin family protein [Chloroflexota bacterium]